MSNGVIPIPDWLDKRKKTDAIIRVLRHIAGNQGAGLACIDNDAEARKLFQDPAIGNIPIEPGGRVVIVAAGEQALVWGGSVILEMPEPLEGSRPAADMTERELLSYVRGSYKYWPNKPLPE